MSFSQSGKKRVDRLAIETCDDVEANIASTICIFQAYMAWLVLKEL